MNFKKDKTSNEAMNVLNFPNSISFLSRGTFNFLWIKVLKKISRFNTSLNLPEKKLQHLADKNKGYPL